MVEAPNKLQGNFIGGFQDVSERFSAIANARPLLPVLSDPLSKSIMCVHHESRCTLLSIYREHLGHFLTKPGKPDLNAFADLCGTADLVLESTAPVDHGQKNDKFREALRERAVSEGRENDGLRADYLLEAAEALLGKLSEVIEREILTDKKQARVEMMVKLEAGIIHAPHTVFTELSRAYVGLYTHTYPGILEDVYVFASALVIPKVIPVQLAELVYSPLMIKSCYMKDEDEEEEGGGKVQFAFKVKVFKGFLYKKVDKCVTPWSGMEDDVEEMTPVLDLGSKAQISEDYKLECSLKTLVAGLLEKQGANPDPKLLRLKKRQTNLGLSFQWMTGNNFAKNVKGFFTTNLGVAVLQSQVLMSTPVWSVGDAVHPEGHFTDETFLGFLKQGAVRRAVKTMELIKQSDTNSAFALTDVTVEVTEGNTAPGYGCLPNGLLEMQKSYKIKFNFGNNNCVETLEAVGLPTTLKAAERDRKKVDKIPDKICTLGLYSPYNSSEASEFGTLTPQDELNPEKYAPKFNKAPLEDLNERTYKLWQYELKTHNINEPNGVLAWFYNARYNMATTVASAIVTLWNCRKPKVTAFEPTVQNGQMTTIVEGMVGEALRGFFVRVNPVSGSRGSTFDLISSVSTLKGYPFSSAVNCQNPKMITSSAYFRQIEWLANSHLKEGFTNKVKTLIKNYNLPSMIRNLERSTGPLFYKRIYYVKPPGVVVRPDIIMSNRKAYCYSPMAVCTSLNVVGAAEVWSTRQLEGTGMLSQINVYRVCLENNSEIYSEAKVKEWNSFTTTTESMDASDEKTLSMLLDECKHGMVKTSVINQYSLTKTSFETIILSLSQMGKYEQDEEPRYADAVAFGEGEGDWEEETPLEGEPSGGAPKRPINDVLEQLKQSTAKRARLME